VTVVLDVRGVHMHRAGRHILNGATFSVPKGGFVALMGASGSGKTTMLRAIAGLERFDEGTIAIDGLEMNGGRAHAGNALRQWRGRMGFVFQFHHLFEHLSVLENVTLAPMHVHHVARPAAESRARELLQSLGVEHRAAALPRELSGGEAQRVAIARALALNPPLLMMDEPTASLDPDRRADLGVLLRELAARGRAIVVSTHDDWFAREFATNVLRLVKGAVGGDAPGLLEPPT
jgi:ABC-type polar amino acid transport system ATPase subunit